MAVAKLPILNFREFISIAGRRILHSLKDEKGKARDIVTLLRRASEPWSNGQRFAFVRWQC
jgi:hypothetical protein